MTRAAFLKLLMCAPLLALTGCTLDRTVRYRLTLEVETPEGLKKGSGVIEVRTEFNDGLLGGLGNAVNSFVRGEAVVVDLGTSGLLFALLIGDPDRKESPSETQYMITWTKWGYPWPNGVVDITGAYFDWLNATKPKIEMKLSALPFLVRFRDIKDPKSVERVDPDNLVASFGPGVKLVRATIEITDDPVTRGMGQSLPWLLTGDWLPLAANSWRSVGPSDFIDGNYRNNRK